MFRFRLPVALRPAFAAFAVALVGFSAWIVRIPKRAAQSSPARPTASARICPYCSLTKQKDANRLFDSSQSEFLTDPKPLEPGPKLEWQVIARVLSASPMIIEVLDTEPWGFYEPDNCGIRVIRSIETKLKASVADLKYNELINARMFFGGDFAAPKVVLSDVKVIAESPVYFHPESGKDVCANRTGILVIYRGRGPQLLIVYNDGSLYYRGVMFKSFHRQKLTPKELEELLKLFATTDFDALPSSVPPIDLPEQPSISLICSRFQDVSVHRHEATLAPLVARLEQLKAKAMSHTYYLLTYKDKRELRLVPWPYQQIPLAQLELFKHHAYWQNRIGKYPGNTEDYSAIYQKLPEEFLDQLPGTFAMKRPVDPNRDVYFSDGGKIFRVEYNAACTSQNPHCGGFDSLRVGEVLTPNAALSNLKEDFENPSGIAFYRGFVGAWLWPTDMSLQLGELPRDGRVINAEEFESHKLFYFELLLAGGLKCNGGIDFLESGHKYEKVSVCQEEATSQ